MNPLTSQLETLEDEIDHYLDQIHSQHLRDYKIYETLTDDDFTTAKHALSNQIKTAETFANALNHLAMLTAFAQLVAKVTTEDNHLTVTTIRESNN